MELSYFEHFFYSVIASAGFAIYINVPKRDVPASAVIGGLGWVLYKFLVIKTGDLVFPYFVATLLIGFLGNVCSYKYKKTSLVYILPGIIPLVPGYSMYYTSPEQGDYEKYTSFDLQRGHNNIFVVGTKDKKFGGKHIDRMKYIKNMLRY